MMVAHVPSERDVRTAIRVGNVAGGVLLVAGGAYYIVFGALYQGIYYSGSLIGCGSASGCGSSSFGATTVTLANYPIWNPPSFSGADYSATATCTITTGTYTPQNPASCLLPPVSTSTDYSRNYGGAVLIAVGTIAGVAVLALGKRET